MKISIFSIAAVPHACVRRRLVGRKTSFCLPDIADIREFRKIGDPNNYKDPKIGYPLIFGNSYTDGSAEGLSATSAGSRAFRGALGMGFGCLPKI